MTSAGFGQAQLVKDFKTGSVAALARAISIVEDETDGFQDLLHTLLVRPPTAKRVGLTGPPGAGKSSLMAAVATTCLARDEHTGVVAVDPSSPQSGGALLGDRIRMNDLAAEPGIFIRSMASRGSFGGLATATKEVIDLMDAFGFDRVMVETVGVGQTEREIVSAADTVVVVLVPESGDTIQAMKAGLMEIADIFVINKADRSGAVRLRKEMTEALSLRDARVFFEKPSHSGTHPDGVLEEVTALRQPDWDIPVLLTNALTEEGIPDLFDAIEAHHNWLQEFGGLASRRRDRTRVHISEVVNRELRRTTWASVETSSRLEMGLNNIEVGKATTYSVAQDILGGLLR